MCRGLPRGVSVRGKVEVVLRICPDFVDASMGPLEDVSVLPFGVILLNELLLCL